MNTYRRGKLYKLIYYVKISSSQVWLLLNVSNICGVGNNGGV